MKSKDILKQYIKFMSMIRINIDDKTSFSQKTLMENISRYKPSILNKDKKKFIQILPINDLFYHWDLDIKDKYYEK